MFIKSNKVKLVSINAKTKVNENGDVSNYCILEIGDELTGITEDIFVSSSNLDLIKDLKKNDFIIITLKNSNGRFLLRNIEVVK